MKHLMSHKVFSSLLNPFSVDTKDISSTGKQQREAAARFPELVRSSNLNLYDDFQFQQIAGSKLLLGLAASFSLPDLYLADVVNESANQDRKTKVFVFDISQLTSFAELSDRYPGQAFSYAQPPVAGLFVDQEIVWMHTGRQARGHVLQHLELPVSAEQLESDLRTLTPDFFDAQPRRD